MERETYIFTTPVSKTAVVIKKDITGREKRSVSHKMLSGVQLEAGKEGKLEMGNIGLDRYEEYRDEMVNQLVVSVADKTENVLDLVLDLPARDTDAVLEEVANIFGNKDFEEKKTE